MFDSCARERLSICVRVAFRSCGLISSSARTCSDAVLANLGGDGGRVEGRTGLLPVVRADALVDLGARQHQPALLGGVADVDLGRLVQAAGEGQLLALDVLDLGGQHAALQRHQT